MANSALQILKWLERGAMPAEIVLAVESATGVPRYELRTDIYPDENFASGFSDTPQMPYYSGGLNLLALKPVWIVAKLDTLQDAGQLKRTEL
jgi:Putative antitoxin of bacterial toxin-antitoxin system, YdaS/YdaT